MTLRRQFDFRADWSTPTRATSRSPPTRATGRSTPTRATGRSPLRVVASMLAVVFLAACNSSNPVAPEAPTTPPSNVSGYNVTVSSSPAQVDVSAEDPATITVSVTQVSDGRAPADGTQVVLNTSLGNFGNDAAGNPRTLLTLGLASGQARTSFFPGDQTGTASLLAQVGESVGRLQVRIVEPTEPVFFILGVQPNVGSPEGGQTVTIQGEGFEPPLRVTFASALAEVLDVPTSRTILVVTPPPVTPVQPGGTLLVAVTVTNALNLPNPPSTTLAGAFTYAFDAPPPFFLLEAQPNTGRPEGGQTISIRGGGFRGQVRVEFGGKNGSQATRVSSEEITVVSPSSPQVVPAGTTLPVDVTVFHALDEEVPGSATLAGGFTYVAGTAPPPPGGVVVDSLSVTSGDYRGGTRVTLSGSGFAAPASVQLAGIQQVSVAVESATSLVFTTAGINVTSCPASGAIPQTGVTVTNLGSGASGTAAGLTFTYTVTRPRIDNLSRTRGRQVGGESLTVNGAGFESPVRVLFVGTSASFAATVVTDTASSITVSTPSVPDTFFPQVDCLSGNQAGKQRVAATASVQVINLGSSCSDTLPNAFTIEPANTGCIPTGNTTPLPQCSDGIDNDRDGFTDFVPVSPGGGDPQCTSLEDDSEST